MLTGRARSARTTCVLRLPPILSFSLDRSGGPRVLPSSRSCVLTCIVRSQGARGDQCEVCSETYESPLELINPRCSACGATPTARTTAHLHIKLAELQPQIEEFVKRSSSTGTWSSNGKAFTDGWLRGGLQSRGMTRDLEWGVRLPKELGEKWEKKVMYVWVSRGLFSFVSTPLPAQRRRNVKVQNASD